MGFRVWGLGFGVWGLGFGVGEFNTDTPPLTFSPNLRMWTEKPPKGVCVCVCVCVCVYTHIFLRLTNLQKMPVRA